MNCISWMKTKQTRQHNHSNVYLYMFLTSPLQGCQRKSHIGHAVHHGHNTCSSQGWHKETNKHVFTPMDNLEWPIDFTCMSFDCGRKPESGQSGPQCVHLFILGGNRNCKYNHSQRMCVCLLLSHIHFNAEECWCFFFLQLNGNSCFWEMCLKEIESMVYFYLLWL